MEPSLNETAVRETGATGYAEARGEIEKVIAQLWREVFHLERVGRDDNFFELGGDSSKGMQLMELFATRLSVQLPVVALFLNPTIGELAQLITANARPE